MPWNNGDSILQGGITHPDDKGTPRSVDADVIFTTALVGLALDLHKNKKDGLHVTMEPEIQLSKDPNVAKDDQRQWRTDKDKVSMKKLNDLCTFVNNVINAKFGDEGYMSWGFCPSYTAGGMIAGGADAAKLYKGLNDNNQTQLGIVRKYLTQAAVPTHRRSWGGDMYIGNGAYCGLAVMNPEAIAVSAMSTIRTTINEELSQSKEDKLEQQIGDRWCPGPTGSYKETYDAKKQGQRPTAPWLWGMIEDTVTQDRLRDQGMQFTGTDNFKSPPAIVGYTHGMIRVIYESIRSGRKLVPYEMSIGVDTFKLASCMGCTFFMHANGYPPSASHMGKAQSWAPLYNTLYHNFSPVGKDGTKRQGDLILELEAAMETANNTWADSMTLWMKSGAEALSLAVDNKTVALKDDDHGKSLQALKKRLQQIDSKEPSDKRVCCNLLLDAFTDHRGDIDRAIDTFQNGQAVGKGEWWGTDLNDFDRYKNPYDDTYVKSLADLGTLTL